MRQAQREITDPAQLEAVIRQAQVCRLAFWDEGCPYIVPLNFGYAAGALYFHCAPAGKKLDLIGKNPRVGFELEGTAQVVSHPELACSWSAQYQSVIGRGTARVVTEPGAKRQALDVLMAHYAGQGRTWNYPDEHLEKMVVLRVDIDAMTGKQSKNFPNL
jgi:nitroimidazol reductase NimA-like FMN-containing flavoprotein (pyridoxamine 5'-phosphate oxidase superfamily)